MDPSPVPEEPPARDWSLLPLDALSSVFFRVGAVDVLMGAGLVCRSWLQAAQVPDVWRVVDMESHEVVLQKEHFVLGAMAKAAVDRSDGQLRVFAGKEFVTDKLIGYIVERSPALTTLRLVSCDSFFFNIRLASVIKESPLRELRYLELDDVSLDVEELTALLENCPVLEVLWVRYCSEIYGEEEHALRAKFPRIGKMTVECAEEFRPDSDFEWDDYDFEHHVPDFEDERTDPGSL